MAKTVSIRMDEENYTFLHKLAKEEREDFSKAMREIVYKGRVMLAIERYKKGQASLGKAAELAGLPIGQMITLLAEYGVIQAPARRHLLSPYLLGDPQSDGSINSPS